jgi:SecD/SecF fusion protein
MTDRQRNGFILVLVIGLIAVSGVLIAAKPTILGLDLKGGVQLTYQGLPTPQQRVVTPQALARAVDVMRQRTNQLGVSETQISTYGKDQIVVGLPNVSNVKQAERLVGTTARLEFYDWEANVLTPNGKPVASLLQTGDPAALAISQGGSSPSGPGGPGGGSLPLYQAVKLAAKQRPYISKTNARVGPEYFLFGKSGSAACTAAAKAVHATPLVGHPCYLAGPATTASGLKDELAQGVTAADLAQASPQTIKVNQGWVVVESAPKSYGSFTALADPTAQFYVMRDHVALFGNDITNPQQSTDQTGQPDVSFGFSGKGASEFQNVTAEIAKRGSLVSGLGRKLFQHFAVALDTQLVTVPYIDYQANPFGIPGDTGADIQGGFTIGSAQALAKQLSLGALPIRLKNIATSQVSATLGKQALNKGLLAGLIGLIAVVIFLIAYYRVLGIIATAGLFVYGLYFFALIKLIPIVLTLPGIAGLILTIGVAADANIVIFERVKEEIRSGRSIRQGIITGYRKGLTAIIDANVVTIMTAFILFVLAVSDVKGFAFTLGIGTFTSLFTAVMATQAILSTMGNSRVISRPSLLGASGKKRAWRFDFMGASRYFFSMSGVILLIGALAVGGRGLNLGIDFTSGTRIVTSLNKPATEPQVASVVSTAGAPNPTVQRISNKQLGNNVYQISSKRLTPPGVNRVVGALQSHFGQHGNPQVTSVGPTFGSTVANSAVIAIIASLLVISAYVALRFAWKFAIPVLIALAHDLLITAGVYSLTGREVTTATVAALLTILGYSLYDTIIVFDRVRENIPRMPRAAFSQIVNRSMSEVLTRSLATTFCTLMPILALLLFGGVSGSSELQDFAFALLIGVASGAYSSIFIASPVLTHWKEREPQFRARRRRIEAEQGTVPAYAEVTADVEPTRREARRTGRLTAPEPDTVSAAEFEQMKRDLDLQNELQGAQTSTVTKRLARSRLSDAPAPAGKPARGKARAAGDGSGGAPAAPQTRPTGAAPGAADVSPAEEPPAPAPDIAENEGMAPVQKPVRRPSKSRRRHGRRR